MARIYDVPVHSRWIYLYYPMRWADLLRRYGRHAWGCGAVIIARGANSVPYPNARPWPTGSGSRRRATAPRRGWRTGEPGRYLRSTLT